MTYGSSPELRATCQKHNLSPDGKCFTVHRRALIAMVAELKRRKIGIVDWSPNPITAHIVLTVDQSIGYRTFDNIITKLLLADQLAEHILAETQNE